MVNSQQQIVKTGYLYSGTVSISFTATGGCRLFCFCPPAVLSCYSFVIPHAEVDNGLSWPKPQCTWMSWLLARHSTCMHRPGSRFGKVDLSRLGPTKSSRVESDSSAAAAGFHERNRFYVKSTFQKIVTKILRTRSRTRRHTYLTTYYFNFQWNLDGNFCLVYIVIRLITVG